MKKPKKWTEVYSSGTKEGDEESRFFRALARHKKYDWRSTGQLVKSSGLAKERVEELIEKYTNTSPPMVWAHKSNENHWGYWERVPEMLDDDDRKLAKKDQDNRIDKHLAGSVVINSQGDYGADVSCDKVELKKFKGKFQEADPVNRGGRKYPPNGWRAPKKEAKDPKSLAETLWPILSNPYIPKK